MKIRATRLTETALFTIALGFLFLVCGAIGARYPHNAWVYPVFTACMGFLMVVIQIVRDLRGRGRIDSGFDIGTDRSVPKGIAYIKAAKFIGWLAGIYVLIYLIGFKLGILIYVLLFTKLEGRARWRTTAFLSIVILGILILFETYLSIYWPDNILRSFIQLPYLSHLLEEIAFTVL